MSTEMVFVDVLPGTDAASLSGLGSAIVLRDPDEPRPPGNALWRGALPQWARAGDGLLIGAHELEYARNAASRGVQAWVICHHPSEVSAAQAAGCAVWLRGLEAGGRCGLATTLVLIRAVYATNGSATPWVAQGLTAGARAASLAVGAAGTVLGPQVWACKGSPLAADRADALRSVDLRRAHTQPIPRSHSDRDSAPRLAYRTGLFGSDVLGEWWRTASAAVPAVASLDELGETGLPMAQVVQSWRQDLAKRRAQIRCSHPLNLHEDPLGTGVPIVQGPMANVAEDGPLAQAVANAGGLPFVALGALDPRQADAVLGRADQVSGTVGAGLIAFDVAPHRDAHLEQIKAHGPRPLIIAGGSIPLATSLTEQGFEAWMHTPSPRLAGLALSAGVPAVVLEGHEAGGHVGPLPSSWLWERGLQAAIDAVDRGRVTAPLVVLAGGIGDAISAAFAAALAASAHNAGVRIALQVGTAFFATSEISDQLTQTCRDLTLRTTDTVLVGSSVGLPLRCAPNAFTDQAVALEQEWLTQGLSLMERRLRMESQNVGRTRVAAKGIERAEDWDGHTAVERYRPVPEARQEQEGAFTLGQGAMVTRHTQTVAELMHALTAGARQVLAARDPWGEAVPVPGEPSVLVTPIEVVRPLRRGPKKRAKAGVQAGAPIAIVGVGCVLPGGADVVEFWRSQVRGCDAVGPIPATRWDPDRYHDPEAGADGPAYSASIAAALVAPVAFDSLRYRIPPTVLATVDPSQRLALLAADEAFTDAGWAESGPVAERASVVLGNAMGGEWSSRMALRVRFRELVDALVADGELDADARAALEPILEARLDRDLLPLRPDSMVGLLGNLVAARVAAWLDWRGGTHTVDAACAASLVAVGQAVDALRLGRVDAVLTGGIDTDLAPETYVGFSRTLALSSGGSRPFSSAADGFVMGEGGAVFALKRLDEAMADGDPIWAVIRGVATASDGRGRGLTAPLPDGQIQAVRTAWADAGLDPRTAAYVEAHGTGTTLGDRTEATVLSEVFAKNTWVGSAKGAVGHLKSAAGAVGLLRAVLTVATGVVPPTLHAGDPIREASGLRLPRRATRPDGGVARAGVSAFGFGGTNAHIVVEAPPSTAPRPRALKQLIRDAEPFCVPAATATWTPQHPASNAQLTPSPTALLFSADTPEALALAIEERRVAPPRPQNNRFRAAILALGEDAALRGRVAAHIRGQVRDPDLGRRFWLGEGPARPVVGLVPGQGTQRSGALASVRRFPACHARLSRLKKLFSSELSAPATPDTRHLHAHLFSISAAWAAVLDQAEIRVDLAIGHSLGEWGAAVLAGAIEAERLAPAVQARGDALHGAAKGAMLAVIGPPDEAEDLARHHTLDVAAHNSNKTTILSGSVVNIQAAHAASGSLRTVRVPVAHPFHSPAMVPAAQALVEHLKFIPNEPHPRWISAMSADHSPLRDSLLQAITQPVQFAGTLKKAPSNALFIEVGPGATLTAHARAMGLDAIALDPKPATEPHGVHRAALALWAAGHPGLMDALPDVYVVSPTTRRPVGPAAHAPQPIVQAEPIAAPDRAPTSPTPAAAPGPHIPSSDTRTEVIAAIAEVTGYDAATIVSAQDLQRDLGVDSIQRLEVLGLLQQRLNLHTEDEDLASLSAVNVDVLVDLVSRSAGAAGPSDEPIAIHALRPVWRCESPSRCAPPSPGWSTNHGRIYWVGATETSPFDATLSALAAAQSAPDGHHPWVAWVPNSASGRAAAAALRIAAAEAGCSFTEARVEPGAQGLAEWPEAEVIEVLPNAIRIREWAHHLGPAPTPHARVLATGGVRGIVVPILRAIAPEQVCLVGRTPAEHPDVESALTLLKEDGIDAEYHVVDLTTPGAVEGVASQATLVLHGAGALRDALLQDVTPDDVQHAFGAKVAGLSELRRALPNAHICALSSLAAHAPSPGQFAYAAANAAVEALADSAIASTAWSERGMASSSAVQAALRARGVTPLPLNRGAQRVAGCVGLSGTTLIATHSPPYTQDLPWPATDVRWVGRTAEIGLTLDPSDPRLAHHQVAGQVVVPAAVWLDLVLAILEGMGLDHALSHVRITAPCTVPAVRTDVRLRIDPVTAELEIGGANVRFATADLDPPAAAPSVSPPPPAREPATGFYRPDLLFHGPSWQVLQAIGTDGNGTISATLGPSSRAGAIDGAHQLIATWAARDQGWTGLPVGAGRWAVFDGEPTTHLCVHCEASEDHVLGTVLGMDRTGRVVLLGERVRLQRARTVSPDLLGWLRGSP